MQSKTPRSERTGNHGILFCFDCFLGGGSVFSDSMLNVSITSGITPGEVEWDFNDEEMGDSNAHIDEAVKNI